MLKVNKIHYHNVNNDRRIAFDFVVSFHGLHVWCESKYPVVN